MNVEYVLGDHLGSTNITTDTAGAKVFEMRYHETSRAVLWRVDNARWLRSVPEMEWRGYDPALGRMAQADTIVPGGVQGLDRYAYVNNSPLNYVDPSGHFGQCKDGQSGYQCRMTLTRAAKLYAKWDYEKRVNSLIEKLKEKLANIRSCERNTLCEYSDSEEIKNGQASPANLGKGKGLAILVAPDTQQSGCTPHSLQSYTCYINIYPDQYSTYQYTEIVVVLGLIAILSAFTYAAFELTGFWGGVAVGLASAVLTGWEIWTFGLINNQIYAAASTTHVLTIEKRDGEIGLWVVGGENVIPEHIVSPVAQAYLMVLIYINTHINVLTY